MTTLVAPVLLAVMALVGVLVQVPQNTSLSPIDEWVYVDYLAKVPTQGVVTQGEPTGETAREAFACRGVAYLMPPDRKLCAAVEHDTERASAFPMDGTSSADIYTPLYFWATWVIAQGFHLFGVRDLVVAGSAAGAVWLAAAMVFFAAALRRFRVSPVTTVGIGAVLLATPVVFWSDTYISTDAPSLLVGSALLWLFARVTQGASGKVAFVAVSVLGVLLKVQNVLGVGALALALLAWSLTAAWGRRADVPGRAAWLWRGLLARESLTAIGAVVAGVAAQAVWLVVRAAIASGPSPDQGVGVRLDAWQLAHEAVKFLLSTPNDPTGRLAGVWYFLAGQIAVMLALGGTVALVAVARRGSPEAWLGRASLVVALLGGPLLALGVGAVAGFYFQLPTRYGLSLLPLLLASAAIVLTRRRALSWIVLVAGVVCWIGVLTY